MRRFIAFIILAVSVMLGLGFMTPSMMKNANLSLDYTSGKEFVYSVERKSDGNDTIIRENEMNEVVNNLSARLDAAGVDRYQVIVEDNNTSEGQNHIRVQVSADYNDKYDHIKRLISFDSKFTLATSDSQEDAILEGEVAFGTNKARVAYKKDNPQAYFVIPLRDDSSVRNKLKDMIDHAKSLGTTGEDGSIDEAGKILLWSDFDPEVDSLAKSKEEGQEEMAARILVEFDPNDLYFDEDKTELGVAVLEHEITSAKSYALNSDVAKTYVDLFNAKPIPSDIDIKLSFIFEDYIDPLAEAFISYGKPNTLAFSRTLIAICIALVLVSIFMIVFYRIQGLNAVINMLVSLFVTFTLFNAVGMVFNVGALIGLIVVSVMSLVSSVIYIECFKNEVYRGRSLKKANQEAQKRTFASLIDTHLVILIASLVTYFVGHSTIQSLAILGVIGSLVSFIVSITFNRLMTWLITNDTSLQKKYSLFAINKDVIPDISKEEKQTYYGPFEKVNFTKKSKRNSLGVLIATVVFTLAMIGFGVFGNGVVNNSKGVEFTRAYFVLNEYGDTIRDNNKTINIEYFENKLEEADLDFEAVKYYESTDPEDNETKIHYYVVDFDGTIDPSEEIEVNSVKNSVQEYLNSIINISDNETDVLYFNHVRQVGTNPVINITQPALSSVLIATAIVVVISAIYIAVRFGINKGIVTLGTSLFATFLPLGFFSLTRIEVNVATFVALIGVALINALLTIIHTTKAKEVLSEKRNEEVSILDNSVRAMSLSGAPLLATGVIAAYLALDFLAFGHPVFNTTFIVLLLGILLSIMLNLTTFTSSQMFLDKHIGSLNIHLPKHKAKQKKKFGNIKGTKDSSEPEEALYPGIND